MASDANAHFHELYDDARARETLDAPVLVVLQDLLVLVHDGARHERAFTPAEYHVIKTVAHVPVAFFAASHGADTRRLERLAPAIAPLRASVASLGGLSDHDATIANLMAILADVDIFMRRTLEDRTRLDAALSELARSTGPRLLRCTRDATRIQLAALHAHATRMLAPLDSDGRHRVEVVVAGAHQARVRSLAMQYFERLLEEPPGAEVRVSYAEGVADVEGALALVGTRRLDRAIALAFFGDARRLQRDVLGDAAKEQLDALALTPLL